MNTQSAPWTSLLPVIEDLTGIQLPESLFKQTGEYICGALESRHLRPDQYRNLLETDAQEKERLCRVITINETYFFREQKAFEFLQNQVLPDLRKNQSDQPYFVWSSSCSSGEEALSLFALFSRELGQHAPGFVLTASDLSESILQKFRKGSYHSGSFRSDGSMFHPYLSEIATRAESQDAKSTGLTVCPDVLESIDIRNLNLFSDSLDSLPMMNLVFLRNTLIYMNQQNKNRVIDRVQKLIRPGGLLITSATEIPQVSHPHLQVEFRDGFYFLRKTNPEQHNHETLRAKVRRSLETSPTGYSRNSLPPPHAGPVTDAKPAGATSSSQKREAFLSKLREQKEETINTARVNTADAGESACGSSPEQNHISLIMLCRAVQALLHNPLRPVSSLALDQTARTTLEACHCIEHGLFIRCGEILQSCTHMPSAMREYLSAWSEYQQGNCRDSLASFEQAILIEPDFWPARFRRISAGEAEVRANPAELSLLSHQIEAYIAKGSYEYQFLLGGFNARYYQLIIDSWLSRSISSEVSHGIA